ASVEDHDSLAVPPPETLVGVAANETTGAVAAIWSCAAVTRAPISASSDTATLAARPLNVVESALVIAPLTEARALEPDGVAPSRMAYFNNASSGSTAINDVSASRAWRT